jgi:hypothetical protein
MPIVEDVRMSDDIINQTNQVRGSVDSGFYSLWYGRAIRLSDGRMRLFNTAEDAWIFLARCDSAGRVLQ